MLMIVVITIMLLLVCIGIFYSISLHYKQKLSLQDEQIRFLELENDLKGHEIVSLDTILKKQEHERNIIINDLHDNLGSMLAAVKMNFENLENLKKPSGETENLLIKNTGELLDQSYYKIRRLAISKNYGVMAEEGLVPALKKLAAILSENTGINIQMLIFNLSERLGNAQEISILMTVHELCLNIVKHSNATEATIQLTGHDNMVNIIAEDNGKGFNRDKALRKGSGLKNISERVALLNGAFRADSTPGKGATIIIDIPI